MTSPADITFDAIVAAVAAEAGLPPCALRGRPPRGNGPNGLPYRRLTMLVRRIRPDLSLRVIGRLTGGRTVRSIQDSVDAAEVRHAAVPEERDAVAAVLERLGLDHLPNGGPDAARLRRVIQEIRWAEARLETLLGRRAELEARL